MSKVNLNNCRKFWGLKIEENFDNSVSKLKYKFKTMKYIQNIKKSNRRLTNNFYFKFNNNILKIIYQCRKTLFFRYRTNQYRKKGINILRQEIIIFKELGKIQLRFRCMTS